MHNPFVYGRGLGPEELVGRVDEVAAVAGAIRDREKLFLIGPRRYGKTSILQAASREAQARQNAIVLRYDAEAYPRLELLAERLVAEASRHLTTVAERTTERVARLFGRLRPQFSLDPADGTVSVSFNVAEDGKADISLITDALDGIEKLAVDAERPVAVIIDEFQRLVEVGGRDAEGLIHSVIRGHRHVAYVFAGSDTRLLTVMTTDPTRPFSNMGRRWFVGPISRPEFLTFLRQGFRHVKATVHEDAIERIIEVAADVPYNVRMLAHACWDTLRDCPETKRMLTVALVDASVHRVVNQLDSMYSPWWIQLTPTQQIALVAFIREQGRALFSHTTVQRYGISVSAMQKSMAALGEKMILRQEVVQGKAYVRFVDPFFGIWVSLITQG